MFIQAEEWSVSHSLNSILSHEMPVLTKTSGSNCENEQWLSRDQCRNIHKRKQWAFRSEKIAPILLQR